MNKELMSVLNKLSSITDKVVIKYPITTMNDPMGTIMANINCQDLGCSEFQDMPVYELNKLISILNMFNDYELNQEGEKLTIKSSNTTAVFTLADVELMEEYNKPSSIIEKSEKYPVVAEIDYTADELASVKKALSIFNELNAVAFVGKNGDFYVETSNHNKFNHSSNNYKKEFLGASTKDFQVKINNINFNALPNGDYKLKIVYNEERNAYRVLFISDKFKVLIAPLADE